MGPAGRPRCRAGPPARCGAEAPAGHTPRERPGVGRVVSLNRVGDQLRLRDGKVARLTGEERSVGEVFDAEPPYAPRGCIAQAWDVAELLRALLATSAPDEAAPSGRRA